MHGAIEQRSGWTGLRGRIGARMLANPLRRVLERLVLGDASRRLARVLRPGGWRSR